MSSWPLTVAASAGLLCCLGAGLGTATGKAKPKAAPLAPAPDTRPTPAVPKATSFEELAEGTQRVAPDVARLAEVLGPLVSSCPAEKDGDLAARQCVTIKQWHVERIRERRFLVSGDSSSLQTQPYDGAEKSLTINVTGCIACTTPARVDGAPWLVATKAPSAMTDGAPVGLDLGSHDVPLATPLLAKRWTSRTLPRVRVDYVIAIPPAPTTAPVASAKAPAVIAVTVLGHRVYNRCTGEVIAAQPPSKATAIAGDPTCPMEEPTEEEIAAARAHAALPMTLTPKDIEQALAPIAGHIRECATEFGLDGVAHVKLVLRADGKNEFKVQPPFDKGDANLCLRSALKSVKFPQFQKGTVKVDYPFVLKAKPEH